MNDVDAILADGGNDNHVLEHVISSQDACLYHYSRFTTGVFVISSQTVKSAAKMFYRLLDCADMQEGDSEPMFNLFSYCSGGEYRSVVIFRSRHRSHHYFSEGPDHLTMSPGCADMGGVFIVPVEEEFEKLKGLEHFVINTVRFGKHISHFSLEEAVAVARKVGARHSWLTHLSHQLPCHEELCAELPPHIRPAYDGLIIEA